ncbi:MAG: glycosyltransferase [Pseudomonadota bacterium]
MLRALLEVPVDVASVYVQVDERMHMAQTQHQNVGIRKVRSSGLHRLLAERWLAQKAKTGDLVLCFGNLPPLFRTAGRVVVFLQNRYLVDSTSLAQFPIRTRLRLQAERWWLRWRAGNADIFAVQTPSMATALKASGFAQNKQVTVLPFVANAAGYGRSGRSISPVAPHLAAPPSTGASANPFLYVASGEPHKNHRRLVDAWRLLASEGLFPVLWLTLDPSANPGLCDWVEAQRQQFNLRLKNWGKLPHDTVVDLYGQAGALIYPSTFESFGLPLIEARQAGLPVIASELDFVRDVLDPEEVFDPTSALSIARAVKRFMGNNDHSLPLMTASEFIGHLLENGG